MVRVEPPAQEKEQRAVDPQKRKVKKGEEDE
jgi:hypothetical protein